MVFNATFNNISVILWRSVLLMEETGGLGETKQSTVVSSSPRLSGIQTYNFSVDCTGSCKSYYYTITMATK